MHKLYLKNLYVNLDRKEILKNIHFDVKKGELVSLLGPSGCGKSTLLKTIAGLIEPGNGDILVDGEQIKGIAPEKRGIVIVFQDLRLFPNMNVLENVEFGLKMKGIDKNTRKIKALDMLEKVGLAGFEKRKVFELSGGQKQRVALARAAAAEPEVLLLDEPFSSLDEGLRQKMRELVMTLQRQLKITTVMVTHDQSEALLMSDRVAVMLDGKIIQYDTPRNVYEHPSCPEVANYFGEMNYIKGIVEKETFKSPIGDFKASVIDGDYTLMLKPNHIKVINKPGEYKITALNYLGDKYNVRVEGHNINLFIIMPSDSNIKVGDIVSIEIGFSKGIFYKL